MPSEENNCHIVPSNPLISYHPFCDDFGPMNILSVMKFIQDLDQAMEQYPASLIFQLSDKRRDLTNTVFLLGAYMVVKFAIEPEDVFSRFDGACHSLLEPYRDASFSQADFDLTVLDCWKALKRGMILGWFAVPCDKCRGWDKWGKIYSDEYAHFDNPCNGELHEVIPGKIIAFKGPRDLGDQVKSRVNKTTGIREFSPAYYVDVFRVLGVSAIVRLNEPEYDAGSFVRNGFQHMDIPIREHCPPPSSLIASFLKLVDEADGPVAVHCRAGLGRTGSLVAIYLMRSYGFTAREAIGWLRIMRPGSVIGQQQHFLCSIEHALHSIQCPPPSRTNSLNSTGSLSSAATVVSPPSPPPSPPHAALPSPGCPQVTATNSHTADTPAATTACPGTRRSSVAAGSESPARAGTGSSEARTRPPAEASRCPKPSAEPGGQLESPVASEGCPRQPSGPPPVTARRMSCESIEAPRRGCLRSCSRERAAAAGGDAGAHAAAGPVSVHFLLTAGAADMPPPHGAEVHARPCGRLARPGGHVAFMKVRNGRGALD